MGIALGIATSVFAIMDALTHPDPPFREVGQLYSAFYTVRVTNPPPAYVLRTGVEGIEGVDRAAGWRPVNAMVMLSGEFRSLNTGVVSASFFDVLDARMRLGRRFNEGDAQRGDAAIVTDRVWRRDFGNRGTIGDATAEFDGRVYRVVGVLEAGTERAIGSDVFVAAREPVSGWPVIVVRLGPGFGVAEFQPRLKELNERLTRQYAVGPGDRGIHASLRPVRPDPLTIRDYHRAMVGAALCILLIACANVAALMLARGFTRRRDYALRLALGAQRVAIGCEVVTEIAVLAVLGCAAGILVTSWAVGLVSGAMPPEMEWEGFVQPQWSWRVLGLAALAVVVSVALAGGVPAWMAARTDPAGLLKEGSSSVVGRVGTRFRWLVIAQVAVAMTLLMSTSLMQKSIRLMERYDFGYPLNRLVLAYVSAPWRQDSTSVGEMQRREQQALGYLRAVPAVLDAQVYRNGSCGIGQNLIVSDRTAEGGPSLFMGSSVRGTGGCLTVGPHFFRVAGIGILEGRDFEDGDLTGAGAAIIDQNAARRLFPGESAVGRRIKFGTWRSDAPWYTVVGVARNHHLAFDLHPELGADTSATVYAVTGSRPVVGMAALHPSGGSLSMIFLARMDSSNSAAARLAVARSLAPLTPPGGRTGVMPWDEGYTRMLASERFLSLVFACLGIAALFLAAAGLYSVVSYIAGQRLREFAVRIALGATRANVARLVLREAFLMAIGGTAVGAGFGMWAAFLLWDRMWGVYPVDSSALVAAEAVLIATTMAACLVPAWRATRAEPTEIMRAT